MATADKAKAAPEAETKAEAPKRLPGSPMTGERIKEQEFQRTVWVATALENTEPEDLLRTEYWAHVSAQLKPWDRIEVRANDGSWLAELLVLETARNWSRVHILNAYKLTTTDMALTQSEIKGKYAEFRLEHMGPHDKWCVIRRSDNQKLHSGAENHDAARDWLDARIKAGI